MYLLIQVDKNLKVMIRKFYLFIFLATLMFLMSSSQEACARELQLTNVLVNSSLGDLNDDGTVSVSDVMALVHIILNGEDSINNVVVKVPMASPTKEVATAQPG